MSVAESGETGRCRGLVPGSAREVKPVSRPRSSRAACGGTRRDLGAHRAKHALFRSDQKRKWPGVFPGHKNGCVRCPREPGSPACACCASFRRAPANASSSSCQLQRSLRLWFHEGPLRRTVIAPFFFHFLCPLFFPFFPFPPSFPFSPFHLFIFFLFPPFFFFPLFSLFFFLYKCAVLYAPDV